ncbi:MAG: VCBS repeat-containing protein [Anaerolineales bacterium]|nr:VCBS repeat-containing protein [Anaerolineales bacterium]
MNSLHKYNLRNFIIMLLISTILVGMMSQPGEAQAKLEISQAMAAAGAGDDFILASQDGTQINLYPITGSSIGTSIPIHTAEAGFAYTNMAIADFDGDGDHDFIAVRDDRDMYYFEQTEQYTFAYTRLAVNDVLFNGTDPYGFREYGGIVTADFDNDGHFDFAAQTSIDEWTGQVFIGQGNGEFEVGPIFNYNNVEVISGHYKFAAGYINGDQAIDIVVAKYHTTGVANGEVFVGMNDGTGYLGTLFTALFDTPQAATNVTVGDFDGDSLMDIIAGQDDDGNPGAAWFFKGNGDGTFVETVNGEYLLAYDTNTENDQGDNEPGGGRSYPFDVDGDGIHDLIIAWDNFVGGDNSTDRYNVDYFKEGGIGTLFHKASSIVEGDENRLESSTLVAVPPIFELGAKVTPLMANGADVSCEALCNDFSSTQGWAGSGINTLTGNYSHQTSDITLPVSSGGLSFKRSYASQAINAYPATGLMGAGWIHNYDMQLHIGSGEIVLQMPDGSQIPFKDDNGTFKGIAGVTSSLVKVGNDYVLTSAKQTEYTFNSIGQLIQEVDAFGNTKVYTYVNGKLDRVAQDGQYLDFGYNANGRLDSVTDTSGRSVTYGYDVNGNLETVTDLNNKTTTYHYDSADHLLTSVEDPTGRILEETGYDASGRAYQQWENGNLVVDINRSQGNVVTVAEDGVTMTHTYSNRDILANTEYVCSDDTPGCGAGGNIDYNNNFNQDLLVDANGNPTVMDWQGGNLAYIRDAKENETVLEYNTNNTLSKVTDANSQTTEYHYDDPNFPTFVTGMTDARDKTTTFVPNADGLVGRQTDPNGVVTSYQYNDFGQVTAVTQAFGTSSALTTSYGYDGIGRLITTTRTSAAESHTDLTVYDDGNRVIATIANWTGSDPANWQADCDTSPGPRDTNACTQYGYDDAGRVISTTNTLGQTDLTFYDDAGRPYLAIRNWDGTVLGVGEDPQQVLCSSTDLLREENLCTSTEYDDYGRVWKTTNVLGYVTLTEYDSVGRVDYTITNYVDGVYDAAYPDEDIISDVEYDAQGNVIVSIDVLGRKTRTFYDVLNRVEGTIVNWDGDENTTLADCDPLSNETNICTQYEYDNLGRQTIVTNALGQRTKTFYGPTGLVEGTIANWDGTIDLTGCVFNPLDVSDDNVCTVYGYDNAGQRITTKNAVGQQTLTVYDELNRPFLTVAGWDGATVNGLPVIDGEEECSFPPDNPDENLCSVTYYDALGRRSSVKDVMGNMTEFGYDGLSRQESTTRYLDGQPVTTGSAFDALGNRRTETNARGYTTTFDYDSLNRLTTGTSPEGISPVTTYNVAGWVVAVTDDLNHVTTTSYDKLGRQTSMTDANLHVTTFEYDGLNNQTAMIDAEGVRTTYGYDDLNRLTFVIENDVPGENPTYEQDVLTQYTYDALGNRKTTINARGYTTVEYFYDDLNRPEIERDALGNDAITSYNRVGSKLSLTDRNGEITVYGYDGLNRLTSVDYQADGETVIYQYYANGNRKFMTDAQGTTSYLYDDLYRLTDVTDAFNQTVSYGYDLAGNRDELTYPDNRNVTYVYDKDNRMTDVLDWNTGTTSYHYDAAGHMDETTLPNGVVTVNVLDAANRLTDITYTSADGVVIAEYHYILDKVGNRTNVTEKLHATGSIAGVNSYLEENGLVVMEAEKHTPLAGISHAWEAEIVDGINYMKATPDVGATEGINSPYTPSLHFNFYIGNPDVYTLWVRGFAPDAGGDSVHAYYTTPPEEFSLPPLSGFIAGEWSWSKMTMDNTDASADFAKETVSLGLAMREDGFRIDKILLTADANYIPIGWGPTESTIGIIPHPLDEQTIVYDYDDLYRLVSADYTGLNTASYSYMYDAAGNMTDFSETVEGDTVTVSRSFNAANQLSSSNDGNGSTSYTYDDNGNLTVVDEPLSTDAGTRYTYNQRNLLVRVASDVSLSPETINHYTYDGDGNRVQQEETHSQGIIFSVKTTYTSDNAGVSQVLVAAESVNYDPKTTTYNLFGLDLIYQDDGTDVRYMLADGLGSVRQELVGTEIAYVVTNDPFGGMLAMQGESGTTYGYTGEQEDSGSGLIYLRARYYDPALKVFLSRDPFSGWDRVPASQNGYSYAHNNPVNYTDPTGEFIPFIPLIVGGVIIGVITGVTWDVMINQGASSGGFDQIFNGQLLENLRCKVNWQQTQFYGQMGGAIGAVAAPAIELALHPAATYQAASSGLTSTGQWTVAHGVSAANKLPRLFNFLRGAAKVYGGFETLSDIFTIGKGFVSSDPQDKFNAAVTLMNPVTGISMADELADALIGSTHLVPAREIFWSQLGVTKYTSDRIMLDDLSQSIASGWNGPPLRIYNDNGKWVSLDNRRLTAAKLIDADIPVVIVDPMDPSISSIIENERDGAFSEIFVRYEKGWDSRTGIIIGMDGQILGEINYWEE